MIFKKSPCKRSSFILQLSITQLWFYREGKDNRHRLEVAVESIQPTFVEKAESLNIEFAQLMVPVSNRVRSTFQQLELNADTPMIKGLHAYEHAVRGLTRISPNERREVEGAYLSTKVRLVTVALVLRPFITRITPGKDFNPPARAGGGVPNSRQTVVSLRAGSRWAGYIHKCSSPLQHDFIIPFSERYERPSTRSSRKDGKDDR